VKLETGFKGKRAFFGVCATVFTKQRGTIPESG
jgi:hypothetical protein